ncbi:hypothetical protein JJQ50_22945 [Enterobacter cloacae]|uniref:hypothetical protein n=1 Tax=Enterobacter TaxID=547 RepID=UPI000D1D2A21|nr:MULTISPECIES: hypothetical protein [Enterobacter]MBJ6384429.1 hypothetical protein [Enterobacter cloacae]MBJ6402166.1 hypothetical protein [Enterobacter cloacae]MBJ6435171.1 hypothetical protein [Enterobacter cloacae]MBJ6519100.1 hypothetical protein [Enterobacter cloacae]MBJ6576039.1 hypothetical protein [Enterobacter cloacae]
MNTLTKEWLLKTIAELEEERDAVPGIVNEDAAMSLAAMKLALASLEARGRKLFTCSACGAEGLDEPLESKCNCNEDGAHWIESVVYTAPPVPVSVPDEVNVLLNHLEDVLPDDAFNLIDVKTWNNVSMLSRPDVYRAAMLQGAEPVTTAYKLRDAVETIRNSGIEIDAEKIFAERDALNAPDCWCRTCRPITLTDMRFVVCPDCGNKRCPRANDHRNACTGSNDPGQEGSAYPAAPQQEVK